MQAVPRAYPPSRGSSSSTRSPWARPPRRRGDLRVPPPTLRPRRLPAAGGAARAPGLPQSDYAYLMDRGRVALRRRTRRARRRRPCPLPEQRLRSIFDRSTNVRSCMPCSVGRWTSADRRQGGEHVVGEVGPTHEEIGEPGVRLVVAEGAAVEARGVEAGGGCDGDGGGAVPLVLAAGVGVDVGGAGDDGHGLGPGGAHRHQLGVELGGEGGGVLGGTCAADEQADRPAARCWGGGRGGGGERGTSGREGDGAGGEAAALDEGDVDGPVGAVAFTELAGAVEGVDDPHPVGVEAGGGVDGLLGEDGVVGAVLGEAGEEQLVGAAVAFVLERLALESLDADPEEELARLGGEPRRQLVVVVVHGTMPMAWRCSTICSALASGVVLVVSRWTSGASGTS